MKNNRFPTVSFILTVIFTALFVLFKYFLFDLSVIANAVSLGFELLLGLTDYALLFFYIAWTVFCVIYSIVKAKKEKLAAFVPAAICVFALFFTMIFPMTNLYRKIDYAVNMSDREKTVRMAESGELDGYATGMDVFKAPFRHTSYTRKVYVRENNGVTMVKFYIYRGYFNGSFAGRVLIYVSDASIGEIDGTDCGYIYSDIEKADKNWYFAVEKSCV